MELFGITFTGIYKFIVCAVAALLLGLSIAFSYTVRNRRYSKSFVLALFALPVAVTSVLMMIGSQVGAAIAISGAFALVRFRSIPCTAKELVNVFMAMIVGVAVANASADALLAGIIFTAVACAVNIVFNMTRIGETKRAEKTLRITIPESLDYTEVFDDLFARYTAEHELVRVKTANMGSLFQLTYEIVLKDAKEERAFLNDLRARNGNLDIICAKTVENYEKL